MEKNAVNTEHGDGLAQDLHLTSIFYPNGYSIAQTPPVCNKKPPDKRLFFVYFLCL